MSETVLVDREWLKAVLERHKTCNPFTEEHKSEVKELVKKICGCFGEDFVATALVEGSYGYYSPCIAYHYIKELMRTGWNFTERTVACYHACGLYEVGSDIDYLLLRKELKPEYVDGLIAFVRKLKDVDGFEFNATFSALYPSKVI